MSQSHETFYQHLLLQCLMMASEAVEHENPEEIGPSEGGCTNCTSPCFDPPRQGEPVLQPWRLRGSSLCVTSTLDLRYTSAVHVQLPQRRANDRIISGLHIVPRQLGHILLPTGPSRKILCCQSHHSVIYSGIADFHACMGSQARRLERRPSPL